MAMMKVIRLMCVLALAMFIGACGSLDKKLTKIDNSYNSGDYSSATSGLAKYKKKVTSKFGQSNKYMPGYYIREAKVNLNSGQLSGFETSITNAVNASFTVYGEASASHAQTLADVAEAYNQYGNYRLAREYSEKALAIIKGVTPEEPVLKSRIDLELAEAMIGQGFYNEALEILTSNEKFLIGRAVEKETYVEEGKIKNRFIPENELDVRYSAYAKLLTLTAYAHSKQGNLDAADTEFKNAHDWISKNKRYFKNTNLSLVYNDYLYLNMFVENNNGKVPENLNEKYLDYSDLLSSLKGRTEPSVPLSHDIYLAYLDQLQREESNNRFANLKSEYDRMLGKYFTKSSLMNINLKAIEFNSKLKKSKTGSLEADALTVINSKNLPKNYKTTIRTYEFLADMALQVKRYSNVEHYLNQIIEIKKELYGENTVEYHLSKLQLAMFYVDYTNKIDEARKIFDESYINLVAKEISAKHKDRLAILNSLARLYELTDNFSKARATLTEAVDAARFKYDNKHPDYGVALDQISQLQIKLGMYDEATNNIKDALKILEEYRKDDSRVAQYIHAIETQARLYGIKGMFDDAQDNLTRSKKLIKGAKVLITDESSGAELPALLIQLGNFSKADELLTKLVTDNEKLFGVSSIRLIEPLVARGKIQLAKGDYTEAEKTAQRANQIAIKTYTENSTKTASTQRLLSDIYYTLGDYEKAEDNIKKALVSQEKQFNRQHVEVAKSLSQLALIKFYKGDNKKDVENMMIEARDIVGVKLGKDNPLYADILKNLAVVYISEKKFDLAFNSLTIAEAIWRAKTGTKNNINAAGIYTLTGDVYYQQKNYKKSEEFYNKSLDLYKTFFKNEGHPEYVKVVSKLAKVFYMQKEYKKAKSRIEASLTNYEGFIKTYFPALSEREKAKYWNTIKGDFEFYNTLALGQLEDFRDLTEKVYDYQLLTKALLLSTSIKIRERILNSNDENLKNQYNDWVLKKELMTLALSMSPEQLLENEIDPNLLAQEIERLEKELSQKSELFGQNFENKRITYQDVVKTLKPNEVAIEMVRYRYFNHSFTDSVIYAALYVKSDFKRPKAIVLNDGHKLETRNFKYYRNAIQGKVQDAISYDAFWAPIQKGIGQASTIYLSPEGVYNQINLEAIPTPDGKYILDNVNIVLVSNTKDIYLRKVKSRNAADNTAAMFGNPSFYMVASNNPLVSQLPGTEKEINQIQFLLNQKGVNTKVYVEKSATEESIKELNSERIVQVATHGFYKPSDEVTIESELESNEAQLTKNPLMRSGLLLKGAGDLLDKTDYNYNMENGILTAYEAMTLNLDKTELVVLSACETGLGQLEQGEGVAGLQRAFLVAGAKTLIMSMFKVDDDATQKLMLKFYQKWLNSGNLRKSFVDAKIELRNEYPEPIYWGAFMMIGLD